jgi:hypothetical protein
MEHHFALAISCLMATNETVEYELRADRYMLSNHLMGAAANNNRHTTPGLPVKPGLLLH